MINIFKKEGSFYERNGGRFKGQDKMTPEQENKYVADDILTGLHVHAPTPLSATDRLGRNLERTVFENTARAEVLRQEIADREAELADVLRAEEAARMGLEALDDEDLSVACGLALEAEMKIPFEEAPVEILEELLSTEQIPQERFDEEKKRREKANGR